MLWMSRDLQIASIKEEGWYDPEESRGFGEFMRKRGGWKKEIYFIAWIKFDDVKFDKTSLQEPDHRYGTPSPTRNI